MKLIVKLESYGKGLLFDIDEDSAVGIFKLLNHCQIVNENYTDTIQEILTDKPIIKFLCDDEVPDEFSVLSEQINKLKKEKDNIWSENYKLKEEIKKLKEPQPEPVIGVDTLGGF